MESRLVEQTASMTAPHLAYQKGNLMDMRSVSYLVEQKDEMKVDETESLTVGMMAVP